MWPKTLCALAYRLFRGFESEFGKNKKASLEKTC
jgi:hypothetical protein